MYDVQHLGVEELQFNENFAEKRLSELQHYTRKLDTQLTMWKKSVDTAREKYYELNYFTTLQLLELRRELALPTGVAMLKPSVLMLLESISPHISSTVVSESLRTVQHEQEATPMDYTEVEEVIPEISSTQERVERESMDVSTLSSNEPAPASPKASPLDKPSLPALSYEELSEKQQSDFTYLVNRLGYTATYVMRAFQECGQDANVYDIEEWCECNIEQQQEQKKENEPSLVSEEDMMSEPEQSYTEEVNEPVASALPKSGRFWCIQKHLCSCES